MNRYTFQLLGLCMLAGLSLPHTGKALTTTQISKEYYSVSRAMDTVIVPDGFYIPNVITPNGDGINDVLTISCSSVTNFYFQIFNREGQEIFESSSINISWDGRTDGGLLVSDGTYYYVLRATTATGEVWDKTGYITVLGTRSRGNQ